MSKKRPPRFRDVWVNQTELGKHFGMSAIAIGRKLIELGLRTLEKTPTEKSLAEDYCRFTPMKDGTPFYLWNKQKVAALLRSSGLPQLSKQEAEAYDTAKMLIATAREADETGMDKLFYFAVGEIKERDYPLINRFLAQLGSSLHLEEASADPE